MATMYKIGEAAALLNLKTYVLRFWETEFPEIAPLRTEKGQRLYTAEHLALLDRIRYLLHERGLTIGGARKVLAEERARKVTYVLGAHGAVKGLDAESRPDRPLRSEARAGARAGALPPPDPESALARARADDADEAGKAGEDWAEEDDEEEEGDDDEAVAGQSPARRPLFAPQTGPGQYNLPGLGDLAAFRACLRAGDGGLDSGAGEEYGGGEKTPDAQRESPRGMLPLFAVARAAFMAGKASAARDSGTGGGNFIQPGASVAVPDGPGGLTDSDELVAIAGELQAIADLLRAPANSDKGSPA